MKIRYLLTLLFVTLSLYVSADIVYHNVNPNQIILPGDQEFFIDINNDGIDDFSIKNNVNIDAGIYEILFNSHSFGADVVGSEQNGIWGVSVISNGTNLGLGSNFSMNATPAVAYLRSAGYSIWNNQSNKFIGVKFSSAGNTHYGWIRISVSSTNVVTVIDWAYENTPDAIIAAGNIGGGNLMLDADFTASAFVIDAGQCIDFSDLSAGNPTYWEWTFAGAQTPHSYDQNPSNICYYEPGTYDVILHIQNATNVDTYVCEGCITVNEQVDVPIANFEADFLIISQGEAVNFTNLSVNGPFEAFYWEFEGAMPETSDIENPGPIHYPEVGLFDVSLKVLNEAGNVDIEYKTNYIKVVPLATAPPEINFIANKTVIEPGQSINFKDLSHGNPYQWNWTFQGAENPTSIEQNPENVLYQNEGVYLVKLVAKNSIGRDSLIKEDYIIVSYNPDCESYPVANFASTNRLIVSGEKVYFEDLSTNTPSNWHWYFEYGYPNYSNNSNITDGIEYNYPGIYDVTLSVSNNCGTSHITKQNYVYVFTGPISKYCDTISNIGSSELITTIPVLPWGELAGHNSQKIRMYADYYEAHSFTRLEALIVPVRKSEYANINSYVKFYIWDGNTAYPDSILAEKKVLIKDIPGNYYNVIKFNPPVDINGPFYAGFSLNYPDYNNDNISDDMFSVSVAAPRSGTSPRNSLYVYSGGVWQTAVQKFGYATSTDIRPVACLVDIEDIMINTKINIYPNPASDQVNIDLSEFNYRNANIDILDITGKVIHNKKLEANESYSFSVSNFGAGLYFIQITADGKRITKKLSVMH
ncbi:MAG: PKD domain-containing protein [Bacteroidales bacterium]|nr:PKD domain-containing protein [Bacteroidales bacterium]